MCAGDGARLTRQGTWGAGDPCQTLGFTQYVGGLKETLAEHVTESKEGARAKLKAKGKKQNNAMSTEDAIKAQEALFAAARAQMNN